MTSDRIDRMAATPGTLAHLIVEASEAQLDAVIEGGWSARTVVAHLRDDEFLCMRVALERALAEDSPEVTFIEGADWVGGRNTTRDRKEWLLADFALQRQASISILRMLRPADWERTLRSAGRDAFTISQLLDGWLRHDAEHVAQLESALGETLGEVLERRAHMGE
jgi:hypothetical protein